MRNISFALTTPQFRARTKTVTRRLGWDTLVAGTKLCGVEKGMGLGPGGKIVRLGIIRVKSVRQEPLRAIIDDVLYGFKETTREGFPKGHEYHWPSCFVDFFCASHKKCTPDSLVTRIEFEYLDDPLPAPK